MKHNNIQNLEDHDLVDLIVTLPASWRDMLSILLQRHHSALVMRCYAYLKNREDAEDAAQETELRVFRAIKNFRGESSFRTWLFAIADRQCFDLSRRRTRLVLDNHLRALIEIHQAGTSKKTPTPDHHLVVNHVLNRLPEQERDVIMLRYYMDLSLQDVSLTLGIGLSATKMRLYRALDKFATLLHVEQGALCA